MDCGLSGDVLDRSEETRVKILIRYHRHVAFIYGCRYMVMVADKHSCPNTANYTREASSWYPGTPQIVPAVPHPAYMLVYSALPVEAWSCFAAWSRMRSTENDVDIGQHSGLRAMAGQCTSKQSPEDLNPHLNRERSTMYLRNMHEMYISDRHYRLFTVMFLFCSAG